MSGVMSAHNDDWRVWDGIVSFVLYMENSFVSVYAMCDMSEWITPSGTIKPLPQSYMQRIQENPETIPHTRAGAN